MMLDWTRSTQKITHAVRQQQRHPPPFPGQGLRLHDNPALLSACDGAEALFPVFVIDPHFLQKSEYK